MNLKKSYSTVTNFKDIYPNYLNKNNCFNNLKNIDKIYLIK